MTQCSHRSETVQRSNGSGVLVLVCLETGGEIDTGVTYSRVDLERTKAAMVLDQCPYCRKEHLFKFSDARLRR